MNKNIKDGSCVLCGAAQTRFMYRIEGYDHVKCASCGLVWIAPQPKKEELDKYYSEFEYNAGFQYENQIRKDAGNTIKQLERLAKNKGTIFDVGCGGGFLLDEARKHGWKPSGIDEAALPVQYAREKLDLEVIEDDFENFKTNQTFDAVTSMQVIEHVQNPLSFLTKVKKLLKPGGIVCIATPNIDSWLAEIMNQDFNYLLPPLHVIYYTPETLAKMLEKTGLTVVHTETYGYPTDVVMIGKRLIKGRPEKQTVHERVNLTKQGKQKVTGISRTIIVDVIGSAIERALRINNKGSILEVYARNG